MEDPTVNNLRQFYIPTVQTRATTKRYSPELAEVLGVKVATIYDWRYEGHTDRFPPTVRLGSALRWRASDVRKFLNGLKTE